MGKTAINRIKVVLAENAKTNKWLAEQLTKNETTVSRWCTNEAQPSLENLFRVAEVLNVEPTELIATKTKRV
jgi:putative transcriptional regulator